MPYKPVGGDKLQFYDSKNGEYSEKEKKTFNEKDKESLALAHYFGIKEIDLVIHWPDSKIHDEEYCDLFVKYSRNSIKYFKMNDSKAIYLLTPQEANDKSKFLNELGYTLENFGSLISDIYCNTNIQTLTFSRFKDTCLKCIALTTLNDKKVT